MDRKVTAFIDAFGATLWTQWTTHTTHQERFWNNESFLQRTLEDAIATLPQPKLQAALRCDLPAHVVRLQTQLSQQYHAHLQRQRANDALSTLLNEEDVERALVGDKTTAEAVLAIEDATATRLQTAIHDATTTTELVTLASECATQLRIVRARRVDSTDAVEAFYWTQLYACAAAATTQWCNAARGDWCVAASQCTERDTLRRVLQSVVATDSLHSAAPKTSWSSFFRPPVSKLFSGQDLVQARASVYGALLALALSFPVVYDDEDDDDNTSDDSSDDEDTPSTMPHRTTEINHDYTGFAAQVVRQIVLAAKRASIPSDWYLAVLQAFHRLAQPKQFVDEDDDDEGLSPAQLTALHDARAELYARAFATSATLWTRPPLALLDAVLCLRHAAEFLRVTRQQTVPAVATATTQLAGVALPSAFWKWMMQVKKVFAGEHIVVQMLMKKITKNSKSDKKMLNVLLHESVLTLSELRVVVEQFALFLEKEKESAHFVVAPVAPPVGDETNDAPDQVLFFIDNDRSAKSKKRTSIDDAKASKRGRTDN